MLTNNCFHFTYSHAKLADNIQERSVMVAPLILFILEKEGKLFKTASASCIVIITIVKKIYLKRNE